MQSVDRGATLTRQLLAFGRKQNLMPRSVDINVMLREWEKLLLTTLGGYAQLVLRLNRITCRGIRRCDAARECGAEPCDQCARRHANWRRDHY